jgi:hypothetical protein
MELFMLQDSIKEILLIEYNPFWSDNSDDLKLSCENLLTNEIKEAADLLKHLNKLAQTAPFCIMYRAKEHDPR